MPETSLASTNNLTASGKGRVVKSVGQGTLVAEPAGQLEAFVIEDLRRRHVRLPVSEAAGGFQPEDPLGHRVPTVRHCQNSGHSGASLLDVSAHLPETPEEAAQT